MWRETGIMDERLKFVVECLRNEETMTALCDHFGISRKTGYKWLGRYRVLGAQGLHDQPRAPLNHGLRTPVAIEERIVSEKELHAHWGPKKIIARLRRAVPEQAWPSPSTAGAILRRHGLVSGRKRARMRACGNGPWPPADKPNAVWTSDFKGWFRTRDGQRCEPLTIMDASSRYSLGLRACRTTGDDEAWPHFQQVFEEYGLPDRLRSDNGSPFASTGVVGLTPLSMRFVKLGIALERITPGKPQQNGGHERFHLTMLPLAQRPQADHSAQQAAFDAFREEYNTERPHEALQMDVPVEHYSPSARKMPDRLPEPDYPAEAAVRRVRSNGEIKWQGDLIYVSATLVGELVAVEETQHGEWTLRFYNHPLGYLDMTHRKVRRHSALQPGPAGAVADTKGGEL